MQEVKKFLFERSFDADAEESKKRRKADEEAEAEAAEEAEEEAEPPPPTFSEEDLEAARTEAFARGREAGVEEAAQATERRLAETLEAVATRLGELLDGRDDAVDAATRNAVSVAAALTRKVLPTLSRRGALQEVEAMVAEVMDRVLEQPRLTVRVGPDMAEALRDKVTALVERRGYEGRVMVTADDGLSPGDCRIEWDEGGAERDGAALWQEIDEIIERHLGEDGTDEETHRPAAASAESTDAGERAAEPESESAPEAAPDVVDRGGEDAAAAEEPFGAGMEGVGAEGMSADDDSEGGPSDDETR